MVLLLIVQGSLHALATIRPLWSLTTPPWNSSIFAAVSEPRSRAGTERRHRLIHICISQWPLYFTLNFGDEGRAPVKSWTYSACVVQGTQQIYICALWFWASHLATSRTGTESFSKTLAFVLLPLAAVLLLISIILFFGMPSYYRQTPGKAPSLFASLFSRKIVIWFLVTVLI